MRNRTINTMKGASRPLSNKDKDIIVDLFLNGCKTVFEISIIFGRRQKAIYSALKERNIDLKERTQKLNVEPPKDKPQKAKACQKMEAQVVQERYEADFMGPVIPPLVLHYRNMRDARRARDREYQRRKRAEEAAKRAQMQQAKLELAIERFKDVDHDAATIIEALMAKNKRLQSKLDAIEKKHAKSDPHKKVEPDGTHANPAHSQ